MARSKHTRKSVVLRQGWLAHQPAAFQQEALKRATFVAVGRGDYLHHAGDEPGGTGGVHGLVSGGIGVLVPGRGSAVLLAGLLRPGAWFAHGPVMTGRPRLLTFCATEPSTTLYIPLPALQELVAQEPAYARAVGSLSDFTIDIALATIADLLIRDSARRLASVLLRLSDPSPEKSTARPLELRLRQSELAEIANLSQRALGRLLKQFGAAGWIILGYGSLTLADPDALEAFAAGEA